MNTPTTENDMLLDAQNPWPGLHEFNEATHAFFSGREGETHELLRLVGQAPLTVLFGKSGLGKTSLVKAGLFPKLREQNYLPVFVRLNVRERSAPLITQAAALLQAEIDKYAIDSTPQTADESLWEHLHGTTTQWWSAKNWPLTPLFVFDQFEEVFIHGGHNAHAVEQLRIDLADLIENRIPKALSSKIEQGAHIEHLDLRGQRYKILLSFREDFLPEVENWKAELPSLMRNRLRLLPMNAERALQVVMGISASGKTHDLVDATTAHAIVQFAAAVQGGKNSAKGQQTQELPWEQLEIEPALLSLLCAGLNEKRLARKRPTIDLSLLKESGKSIIGDFYQRCVRQMPEITRRFIEDHLITEGGFRNSYPLQDALNQGFITESLLDQLIKNRLLRIDHQLGADRVELIHDRLTETVSENRNLERKKLRQQKRQRNRWLMLISFALLVITGVTFLSLWWQADSERNRTEKLVGFLLGEKFLGEIRDVGRTEILEQVVAKTDTYLASNDRNTALNRSLAMRNAGDVELALGSIEIALLHFTNAWSEMQKLPTDSSSDREMARTQNRIGNALTDQGEISNAMTAFSHASDFWRKLLTQNAAETEDCSDLAENLVLQADLQNRMGQTDLALGHMQQAVEYATAALFSRHNNQERCTAEEDKIMPQPHPKALQALSAAIVVRASILNFSEDYENAAPLTKEAARLSPLSSAAKLSSFVALSWRGNGRTFVNPQQALADYQQAHTEADTLLRGDPDNQRWLREWAATNLLVAEGIIACRQTEKPDCQQSPSIHDAEMLTLDAIVALRNAIVVDKDNQSLKIDLAWALEDHAKVLALQPGREAESLVKLKESLAIYRDQSADPANLETENYLGFALLWELTQFPDLNSAAQALQESLAIYTKLSQQHPDNPIYLGNLLNVKAEQLKFLHQTGAHQQAQAVEEESKQLQAQLHALNHTRSEKIQPLLDEGTARLASARNAQQQAKYPQALLDLQTAESAMRRYITYRPADFHGYAQLQTIYSLMATIEANLETADQAQHAGTSQEQRKTLETQHHHQPLSALNAAMQASNLAQLLAPPTAARDLQDAYIEARRALGDFLVLIHRLEEALNVVMGEVATAKLLVDSQPDNAHYQWQLGSAYFDLGLVRLQAQKVGWEGTIRSGLIAAHQASILAPNVALYLEDIGFARKFLAEQLLLEHRNTQAVQELHAARTAFTQAFALKPSNENATVLKVLEEKLRELQAH